MKWAALLLAVVLFAGCAHTHTKVNAGAGTTAGTTLTALVLAGMFIAAAANYSAEPQPTSPQLDPSRRVVLHDCTKPLPEISGNLKCR